jgi:hypothetical protein
LYIRFVEEKLKYVYYLLVSVFYLWRQKDNKSVIVGGRNPPNLKSDRCYCVTGATVKHYKE